MPRGGARAGAGSPPKLDKAITLLRRQIDWCRAQGWFVYKSISRENGRLSEGYCTSTERIPWADKWARLSSNISHYLETL